MRQHSLRRALRMLWPEGGWEVGEVRWCGGEEGRGDGGGQLAVEEVSWLGGFE